jgi:hypothetical protein
MILDPFSAALHTIRDLRDAANAPALARSRRATLMLADHTEHVVDLLQKVDNAHSDDRVSTDIAVRLDRMEACVLITSLNILLGGIADVKIGTLSTYPNSCDDSGTGPPCEVCSGGTKSRLGLRLRTRR